MPFLLVAHRSKLDPGSTYFGLLGFLPRVYEPRPLATYQLWRPEWGVDPAESNPHFDPEVN